MANKLAIEFVENICAAFNRYPTSKETQRLYITKLSGWNLTRDQWNTALDVLIAGEPESRDEGIIPPLARIYEQLHKIKLSDKSNMGWCYIRIGERDYAIRIKIQYGKWVISDLIGKDISGNEIHMQKHIGEPVVDHVPENITSYQIVPDDPAPSMNYQMPTDVERNEYIRAITEKIKGIARM
jgi:hypothetical protein